MYRTKPEAGELAPFDCATAFVEFWLEFDGVAAAGEINPKPVKVTTINGIKRFKNILSI